MDSLPNPGERFRKALNEREARDCIDSRTQALREAERGTARRLTLEEFYQQLREGETHVFSLVLKCDVQGSLEALRSSLLKLGTDEVGINVVHEGVGRISESDVMLAGTSGAIIIGSFVLTLFVRNPYTQSVQEGGSFYENGIDNSAMMWLAIFVGIPASFWAYKRWILPLFEKK